MSNITVMLDKYTEKKMLEHRQLGKKAKKIH